MLGIITAFAASLLGLTGVSGTLQLAAVSVALGLAIHSLFPAMDTYVLDSLPDGSHAVTVSSTASIIAAARDGEVVRCSARVDRLGRTHAFLSGELRVGDKVVAPGQVVKAVV